MSENPGDYRGYRSGTGAWQDTDLEARVAALEEAGGGGGAGAVQWTMRTLLAADILALHTTPITLAAAPTGGGLLFPMEMVAVPHPGGTPFAGDATLRLRIEGSDYDVTIRLANQVLHTAPANWTENFATSNDAVPVAELASTFGGALLFDSDVALTDGDGTLDLWVSWRVVSPA